MLCFAEFIMDADGEQMLFDVRAVTRKRSLSH
jgi:hypothetical protein